MGDAMMSASPVSSADRAEALRLTPVSRETLERLDRYVALLLQWQSKTNLVSPSTLPHLWTRHIADSLQLVRLAPNAKRWVDFGSGGGFPGIVLACALADSEGRVDLVERNAKKAAFLREALRITGGRGEVHLADIGDYVESSKAAADCVTARALAPLKILLGFSKPLVDRGAKALFLKGQDVESELTEATKYWNITPRLHRSLTGGSSNSSSGWIVEFDRIEPQIKPSAST
jgi:16S rRNA (guanine527-N7)-methyltransferase